MGVLFFSLYNFEWGGFNFDSYSWGCLHIIFFVRASAKFPLLPFNSFRAHPNFVFHPSVGVDHREGSASLIQLEGSSYLQGFPFMFPLQEGKHCLKSLLKMVSPLMSSYSFVGSFLFFLYLFDQVLVGIWAMDFHLNLGTLSPCLAKRTARGNKNI